MYSMQRVLLILFSFLITLSSFAQEGDSQFIHKYLLRADASIVAGYMYKEGFNTVSVNGNLEYYIDSKVSIRGDCKYLLGCSGLTSDTLRLKDNHSILLGTVFHFKTTSHFDPYFILQPGFAYTSSYKAAGTTGADQTTIVTNYKPVISPLGTAGLGFNYYFPRFAHLFVETRYVFGNHLSEASKPLSLQELRITFGLGFNLFVMKEKK